MTMSPAASRISQDPAPLTDRNLTRIADLVLRETGIVLNHEKSALVLSRLHKRLAAARIDDFDRYYDFVTSPSGTDERREMLHALTTNVTRFYREPHHFQHLREKVLPGMINEIRAGRRFRIWSAACSTGEEPYSAAIEVLSMLPDAEKYDVKILATDLNEEVVRTAAAGIYPERVVRNLPKGALDTHFTRVEGEATPAYKVNARLRQLISFNGLNLIKEWPMRGRFDVIFCRNVMIYFNRDTQEMLLERFAGISATGAALYIGHSERLTGLASSWYVNEGLTTYRLARKSASNQGWRAGD